MSSFTDPFDSSQSEDRWQCEQENPWFWARPWKSRTSLPKIERRMAGNNQAAVSWIKGRILILAIVVACSALAAALLWALDLDARKRQTIASLTTIREASSRAEKAVNEVISLSAQAASGTASEPMKRQAVRALSDKTDRLARQFAAQATIESVKEPRDYRKSLQKSLDRYLSLTTDFLSLTDGAPNRSGYQSQLRSLQESLSAQAAALESELHMLAAARYSRLNNLGQIAYSTVFGLVLILCALGALPVARRMQELLERTRQDKEALQEAFDELVRTRDELDSQKTELTEALEEAKGQTALFEHASNRFQQLFGGLPVGCLTYDLGGTIQEWNKAMSDLVRIEGHYVVFQHFSFVFQEYENCPPIFEIIQSVIDKGAKREFEWKHSLQDGSSLFVLYVTYPLRNIRGEILGGILAGVDITARREALMALEASEERLGLALDAASTGIFDWNIKEETQYWSPKVLEILRIRDSNYQPGPFELRKRAHPDDHEAFHRAVNDHLEGEAPLLETEVRVICEDGEVIWVQIKGEAVRDYSGEPIRMTGSIEDISERKLVQLELAESEGRFRDVTDAAGEFVFEVDNQGVFTFLTDRFSEMLGRSSQAMLGQHFSVLLSADRRRLGGLAYRRLLRSQSKIAETLLRCHHSDGSERVLSVSALPRWGTDERLIGYRGTAMDITRQKHAEEELAFANTMLHDTLESIGDSFFSIDRSWRIIYANTPAAASMGATPEMLLGRKLFDVIQPEVFNTVSANASEAMERKEERTFETWNSSTKQWLLYRIYPRQNGASIFSQDVTDRKSFEAQIEAQMLEINEKNVILQLQQKNLEEANRRLEALASTDGLTGLKNHKAFQSSLSELLDEAEEAQFPLSLILLDVDHFKKHNDTYGHPAGDEVLRAVATVLKQQGRRGDIAARYGGEEFVIVLPNTPASEALKAAERVRCAIESHPWQVGAITASLGVASWSEGVSKQELVSRADSALYAAKRSGRNRSILWTEGSGSDTQAA